jgi:sarcosine oxidase
MSSTYDVVVVGLGAMGSAVTYTLARRGLRVLALDRYIPPHSQGSSHGKTRMIREAYYEHPLYVPLVRRAYKLWEELAHEAGGKVLFKKTGGLVVGPRDCPMVTGAIQTSMQYTIPHEIISAGKLRRRFPTFAPLEEWVGVYETRAGLLFSEVILGTYLELARKYEAELRAEEPVRSLRAANGVVRVETARATYEAGRVVVAAGPWMAELLPELALPLAVERQVSYWVEPVRDPRNFTPDWMPVSLWEYAPGKYFFTMPDAGDGVKVGLHHGGETTTPDSVRRTVAPDEQAVMYDILRRFVPFAKGRLLASTVCLYTNTPDGHFIVDQHPAHPEITLVSACSGHGFKFVNVLAECVADALTGRPPAFDLSPFRLSRFAGR